MSRLRIPDHVELHGTSDSDGPREALGKRGQSTASKGRRSSSPSKKKEPEVMEPKRWTPVIFIDGDLNQPSQRAVRAVESNSQLTVTPFLPTQYLNDEALKDMAKDLLEAEHRMQAEHAAANRSARRRQRPRLTRINEVNRQRQALRAAMAGDAGADFASLALRARGHKSTARKTEIRHQLTGSIPDYRYNNTKPPGTADQIMQIMTSPEGFYNNATQVRQQMPTVSTRYIDNHTPVRCWWPKDQPFTGYKERVQSKDQLTCVALCSKTRLIAIQISEDTMDGEALVYFLTEALKCEGLPDRVVVLLDNARFHTSELVRQSSIGQFLLKNVTKCYHLNLMEMVFSRVKQLWKRRPSVPTIDEEVHQMVSCFRQAQLPQDFAGHRRQYLRNAEKLLQTSSNNQC